MMGGRAAERTRAVHIEDISDQSRVRAKFDINSDLFLSFRILCSSADTASPCPPSSSSSDPLIASSSRWCDDDEDATMGRKTRKRHCFACKLSFESSEQLSIKSWQLDFNSSSTSYARSDTI